MGGFFRAEESERPDAVFHDPFARKLAGRKVNGSQQPQGLVATIAGRS